MLSGEGRDGVRGDVAPRLALEIPQSWFALLLVPGGGDKQFSLVCSGG